MKFNNSNKKDLQKLYDTLDKIKNKMNKDYKENEYDFNYNLYLNTIEDLVEGTMYMNNFIISANYFNIYKNSKESINEIIEHYTRNLYTPESFVNSLTYKLVYSFFNNSILSNKEDINWFYINSIYLDRLSEIKIDSLTNIDTFDINNVINSLQEQINDRIENIQSFQNANKNIK